MKIQYQWLPVIGGLLATSMAQAHCGGAFCTVNTNWEVQGVADKPGVRLDLRAEFVDLDQLRHNTHKASPAGVVDTHDETRTINRNFSASLDWNISPEWGFNLRVPYVSRAHQHVHNLDDGFGGVEPEKESWNFNKLGDVQAVGRYTFYQGASDSAGVRFGLKLPTGSKTEKNSGGERAERSLQPGTGSTDAIVGLYYNRKIDNWSWFAQGQMQQVVHEHDDFRPGRQLSADVGVGYMAGKDWRVMLQMNALNKKHDSGANAEPDDSGSTQVFVSPGVSYAITSNAQVYGFLQKPLYQKMHGTQLTADWSAAVGVGLQF